MPVDRIEPNPEQPRLAFDEATLDELAASIREHGVLQPVLRPPDRRWPVPADRRRAPLAGVSKIAEQHAIPALVEDIDDDTALEISIIENLQREDISPLDEAAMYDRMIREHGYSIRKLAEKLGKDKGYLENRLRLADAPPEVRELVSLRKDTLSHAYELMKVADPKKRRAAGRPGRAQRAVAGQAPREDRGPARPDRRRRRGGRSGAGGRRRPSRPRTPAAGTAGTGSGSPSPTTAWSPPSSSSTRPSRSSSASSATRTSSTRSARPTGRTSPST